jgi:hypothetical protein
LPQTVQHEVQISITTSQPPHTPPTTALLHPSQTRQRFEEPPFPAPIQVPRPRSTQQRPIYLSSNHRRM